MESRFVELNGVKLACSAKGSGPVVLYAHGLTSSRARDARQGLVDLEPITQHHQLVAYDARGHGESTGRAVAADYAWSALAGDMLAWMDVLSPDAPVSVIGLSMGTGTLLHAALAAPHRFDKLILTAPPTAWETRAAQVEMYERQAALIETSTPEAVSELFGALPVAPIFRDVLARRDVPDIPHALMPSVFRGAGSSDLPAPDAMRALQQPALILAWESDPGHPVSTAQQLRELLPNATLHVSTTSADVRGWGARIARFLAP